MRVGIHQPNAFPWLGFFHKIKQSDVFVFLDDAAYSKGSYTNRVKIMTPRGKEWLTIPVKTAGKLGQPICETRMMDGWEDKLLGKLEGAYKGTPMFQSVFDCVFDYMDIDQEDFSLAKWNIRMVLWARRQMGLVSKNQTVTDFYLSSQMEQVHGTSTERLISICQSLGADTYLSGSGGHNYQDEEAFAEAGIKLEYTSFTHPTYPQRSETFTPGLSVLDMLFNCNQEEREKVLQCL